MRFEFAASGRIIFGPNTLGEVGPIVAGWGKRALLVVGLDQERVSPLLSLLAEVEVAAVQIAIDREPDVDLVRKGIQIAQSEGCELVIGFGGGSAIDAGKAIAALLNNPGEPLDYLEVIGRGQSLQNPSLPYIAIPTTAGTGAEVTRNAVLASPEHQVKVSLRSPFMLPRLALIDPILTHSLPPGPTASTGLDALTQLLEPFVSHQANPLTDALCREGLRRVGQALPRAYRNGSDAAAREDMALASLFGGLALANAKLGAVHGFAGPLGGMFPAPHGVICARLLPYVMAANVRALESRNPNSAALGRFDEVARLLTGQPGAVAADGVRFIQALCDELRVPPLRDWGFNTSAIPEVVAKSRQASSMKGNPVQLTDEELSAILSQELEVS